MLGCACAGRVEDGVDENLESPVRGLATVKVGTVPLNRRSLHQTPPVGVSSAEVSAGARKMVGTRSEMDILVSLGSSGNG